MEIGVADSQKTLVAFRTYIYGYYRATKEYELDSFIPSSSKKYIIRVGDVLSLKIDVTKKTATLSNNGNVIQVMEVIGQVEDNLWYLTVGLVYPTTAVQLISKW